ncbi:hypothetical protein M011DRAFT_456827 [Sporormia fimetaria CBS 119925]|uniref:Uncharacterized protein n=1 Tax=Sporormia fimetaria CBS 119925 TaxID=1340428 RepID=A0A6A6VFE2_9PLEO|nr:hypothetical protein M011DRAFT_456827 [Sporormia fimetaria CBS 119925]
MLERRMRELEWFNRYSEGEENEGERESDTAQRQCMGSGPAGCSRRRWPHVDLGGAQDRIGSAPRGVVVLPAAPSALNGSAICGPRLAPVDDGIAKRKFHHFCWQFLSELNEISHLYTTSRNVSCIAELITIFRTHKLPDESPTPSISKPIRYAPSIGQHLRLDCPANYKSRSIAPPRRVACVSSLRAHHDDNHMLC